jgi:hypothetical protein
MFREVLVWQYSGLLLRFGEIVLPEGSTAGGGNRVTTKETIRNSLQRRERDTKRVSMKEGPARFAQYQERAVQE